MAVHDDVLKEDHARHTGIPPFVAAYAVIVAFLLIAGAAGLGTGRPSASAAARAAAASRSAPAASPAAASACARCARVRTDHAAGAHPLLRGQGGAA